MTFDKSKFNIRKDLIEVVETGDGHFDFVRVDVLEDAIIEYIERHENKEIAAHPFEEALT